MIRGGKMNLFQKYINRGSQVFAIWKDISSQDEIILDVDELDTVYIVINRDNQSFLNIKKKYQDFFQSHQVVTEAIA